MFWRLCSNSNIFSIFGGLAVHSYKKGGTTLKKKRGSEHIQGMEKQSKEKKEVQAFVAMPYPPKCLLLTLHTDDYCKAACVYC
jgi:hypothetical protein